MVPIQW